MKRLVLATLVLSATATAEVIKCPERFPATDLALSATPLGRIGVARLQPARLSNAYIQIGALDGEQGLQPNITEVKGGLDLRYGLPGETKWLVCVYGGSERMVGSILWGEKLSPKLSDCTLKLRETKVPHGESKWTATATCIP